MRCSFYLPKGQLQYGRRDRSHWCERIDRFAFASASARKCSLQRCFPEYGWKIIASSPALVALHSSFPILFWTIKMFKVVMVLKRSGIGRCDFIVRDITTLTIMVVAAEHIRTLNKYEKAILLALERGMKRYAWVPLEQIQTATKLSESEINYRLVPPDRVGNGPV